MNDSALAAETRDLIFVLARKQLTVRFGISEFHRNLFAYQGALDRLHGAVNALQYTPDVAEYAR